MIPGRLLRFVFPGVVCTLMFALTSAAASAQDVFGTALDSRTIDANRRCTRTAQPGGVTLVHQGTPRTVMPPAADIYDGDRLSLAAARDVRIRASARETHNNEIILAPGLLCGLSSRLERVVEGIRLRGSERADFEFVTESERSGLFGRRPKLTLVIRRGAAVITWPKEATIPLYVHAAGELIRIDGTVVAVAVDSTGREGVLYLLEGTAVLTSALTQPGASQLYHLREGQRSLLLAEPSAPMNQAIAYHTTGWPALPPPPVVPPRAWYATTAAKVGGGIALAGGITALVVALTGDDDGPRTGTIVVRIPR
jgi:hypothetical protein